jgi:hypothetical protein
MKGDIERCFPHALVRENEGVDYLYRASILREQVVDVIRDMVTDIDYPSFKGSLTDNRRQPFYMDVWHTLKEMQDAYGDA